MTPVPTAAEAAEAVARLANEAAPGLVLACYLYGSHARGDAVPASDMDFAIILRDPPGVASERVAAAIDAYRVAAGVQLDAIICTVSEAAAAGVAGWIAGPRLVLFGEDVAEQIAPNNPHRLKHNSLWAFAAAVARLYGGPPAPSQLSPSPWEPGGSTLTFVKATLAAARGELLLATGEGVGAGGAEIIALYRDRVGGPWSALIAEVYARCRVEWGYAGPPGDAARAALDDLRHRAAGFHAHYLSLYSEFLTGELACADPTRRRVAAAHLRAITGDAGPKKVP